MTLLLRKLLAVSIVLTFLAGQPTSVAANPVGDFFKKVGRTISNFRKNPTPPPRKRKNRKHEGSKDDASGETPPNTQSPSPSPISVAPSPTPVPIDIRRAALAPRSTERRDVPYAVAVPNKPGFVTSPYAPNEGFVDVRAFPSSTEVLDPFTGKIFLTP